ncbi:Uncharacterised protein [Dorea longicatena]|nr:Uncharacterised protein [Dorea longicatena]
MIGRKLSTLPTPVKIPLITRLWIALLTWPAVNAASTRAEILLIPSSNIPCSHAPITLNVK